jgi:hypothetical protein
MTNKVSTLITVSNTVFIIVMCILWWQHQQKMKQKQWQPVAETAKTAVLNCGSKHVIYSNPSDHQQQLEFTFTNNCMQSANTWVGQGDSIVVAGSAVAIPHGQKIKSTIELKPRESFVAESTSDSMAASGGCEINFRVIAVR